MLDDKDLAAQLAIDLDGNFHLLVEKYSGPLFRYAYRIVQGDAEDVVQDTMWSAYLSPRLRSPEQIAQMALGAWLHRIALHHCLRTLEKRGRTAGQIPFNEVGIDVPDNSLERARKQKELVEAIDALPPIYREVFFLRFVKDLKIADIALRLGKPEGTIKSIIFRGKKLLRRHFKDFPEEEN